MRKTAVLLALAALAVFAPDAGARPMVAHTLAAGDARLDFLLMREYYAVRRSGDRLVFGTKSRCKPRGTITLRTVRASGDAADVASNQVRRAVSADDVGRRADGGAVAVTSGPDVLGALAVPTRTPGTFLVLRVVSTVYEGCSIGHYREEWAEPLDAALATARLRRASGRPQILPTGRWASYEYRAGDVYVEDILLPRALAPRLRGDRLTFGPAGPCASRGDVRFRGIRSTAKTADAVVRELEGDDAEPTRGILVERHGGRVRGVVAKPTGEKNRWVVATVAATGRTPGTGGCRTAHLREGLVAWLEVTLDELVVYLD